MSKNSDRNLNITINNQEEENEVVISLSTLIKKLRKYLILWLVIAAVAFAASFGYAAINTHVRKANLSALVSFSYDGVEKGLDPHGRDFSATTIKNPAVIEAALSELNMDMSQLEDIRQGITFKGVVPKDAADRIALYQSVLEKTGANASVEKILETSYFPTQYRVYFDYNNTTLTNEDAVRVFNTILEKYKDYFYKTYGYNASIGSAVKAIDYADYDYAEAVDIFSNSISTLKTYVQQLDKEDNTRFRSSATGYTFSDLYEAIVTVESIDLDRASSFITVNNLTKDKDSALAYCEYRIKAYNREKTQLEEELAAYNGFIEGYQKDQIIVYGSAGDDTTIQSSLTSAQYDAMFKERSRISNDLAKVKQRIAYYKERQEALRGSAVGSKDKAQKVEAELEKINVKLDELVELVGDTADDYYVNVTFKNAYNVLVPASDTASDKMGRIVENAKMPLVVLEGLVFVMFVGVAVVEAFITDSRKKKALAEAEGEDGEDSADAESETEPDAEENAEEPEDKPEEKKNSSGRKNKKK